MLRVGNLGDQHWAGKLSHGVAETHEETCSLVLRASMGRGLDSCCDDHDDATNSDGDLAAEVIREVRDLKGGARVSIVSGTVGAVEGSRGRDRDTTALSSQPRTIFLLVRRTTGREAMEPIEYIADSRPSVSSVGLPMVSFHESRIWEVFMRELTASQS